MWPLGCQGWWPLMSDAGLCPLWGFSKWSTIIFVALVLAVPVAEQRTDWATREQEWTSQQAVNWWGKSNPWPRQQRGKDVCRRWAPLLPSLTWSVWVTRIPCWSQQPMGWAPSWRCVFLLLLLVHHLLHLAFFGRVGESPQVPARIHWEKWSFPQIFIGNSRLVCFRISDCTIDRHLIVVSLVTVVILKWSQDYQSNNIWRESSNKLEGEKTTPHQLFLSFFPFFFFFFFFSVLITVCAVFRIIWQSGCPSMLHEHGFPVGVSGALQSES